MKAFSASGYLIANARPEVRLSYTAFLVLAAIGFATVAAMQVAYVGPTPAAIASHYRGGDGPDEMTFAKTPRELVELTHFHAFVMALVYLVMAHLLIATRAPARVKRAAIVGGFAGLAGDLVGVWLVRYAAAAFAWLLLASWVAQWASVAVFVYYPVREMWFGNGETMDPVV